MRGAGAWRQAPRFPLVLCATRTCRQRGVGARRPPTAARRQQLRHRRPASAQCEIGQTPAFGSARAASGPTAGPCTLQGQALGPGQASCEGARAAEVPPRPWERRAPAREEGPERDPFASQPFDQTSSARTGAVATCPPAVIPSLSTHRAGDRLGGDAGGKGGGHGGLCGGVFGEGLEAIRSVSGLTSVQLFLF